MGKKILLVDDERRILDILGKSLSKEGFKVFTATDGESCLKLAQEEAPDLIVLDIMMLGMSGATVSAKLRDNEKTKNIHIIFLTGLFYKEESGNKDIDNSENEFISKSSDLNTQINQIKKALDD